MPYVLHGPRSRFYLSLLERGVHRHLINSGWPTVHLGQCREYAESTPLHVLISDLFIVSMWYWRCREWTCTGLLGHFQPCDDFCDCHSTCWRYLCNYALPSRLFCLAFETISLVISIFQHILPRILLPAAFGSPKATKYKGHVQPWGQRARPKHQPCRIRSWCLRFPHSFVHYCTLSFVFLSEHPLAFILH